MSKDTLGTAETSSSPPAAEQPQDGKQRANSARKPQQRFSRLTVLSLVLLGMLGVGTIAFYAFDVQLLNGQLAAVVALGAISLMLIGQFIRFRERISLRTLLIIVTVLAIGLAYVGRHVADARDESAAVDWLVEHGAQATYGERAQTTEEYFRTEGGWYLPVWVKDTFGAGYFSNLRELNLSRANIKDAALIRLAEIRGVETLDLRNLELTAAGVARMPLPPGIKNIGLFWEQVTPESVAHLGQLPDLEYASIITPVGRFAPVGSPGVSDLSALAGLAQVENLHLIANSIDAEGIAAIAKLPNLRSLHFSDINTNAQSVSDLSGLARSRTIHSLVIMAPGFSDAELKSLEEMPSLTNIYLISPSVTADGVRAFQQARPNVGIIINPPIPGLELN